MPIQPRQSGAISVTVISGLPASGKTTYVRKHMQRGDLIVDWDFLHMALSGTSRPCPEQLVPFVAEARDVILKRLERPAQGVRNAWVIISNKGDAIKAAGRLGGKHIHLGIDEPILRQRFQGSIRTQ